MGFFTDMIITEYIDPTLLNDEKNILINIYRNICLSEYINII